MKIGLFPPFANPVATPEFLNAIGPAAEERGFHSLWAAEHVVLFDEHASRYPYADDGRFPARGESGFLDPFPALAFVAANTTRIRLGTGICLVPQRNPVYTAKEVSTLDWLSNGRAEFGVGVGWLAEEFAALDVPFERRGARCRDYLAAMKSLWCDPTSAYEGEFYSLEPCRQYPKPIQQPHPPICFGGESDAALRRVADIGQGWYGFNLDPDATAERIGRLRELLDARGRRLEEVEISVSPYMQPMKPDWLERYHDAGVDQVILLAFAGSIEGIPAALDPIAEQYVEPARSL